MIHLIYEMAGKLWDEGIMDVENVNWNDCWEKLLVIKNGFCGGEGLSVFNEHLAIKRKFDGGD
jgi:hypothetical protein